MTFGDEKSEKFAPAYHQNQGNNEDTGKILHDLTERVKELTALHHAATLLQGEGSTQEIMEGIVALIPPSWQYPDITHGRLQFNDMVFCTPEFREAPWKQSSSFELKNGGRGVIDVFYTEEMPELFEGPFLREERDLINSLASMLCSYFERKTAEENLIRINENLDEQIRRRTDELVKINDKLREEITERINAEKEIEVYQEQLRRLTLELSLAEWRERQSIAVDLHDHIGQALAMIKIKMTKLQGNIIFCGYDQHIAEIREFLDQTIQYTRTLTFEISPPLLYELGINAAIEWLAEQMEKKNNIKIQVKSEGSQGQLSNEIGMFLYRGTRELIVNAIKHSGASGIDVKILWEDDAVSISVKDNGTGFKTESTRAGLACIEGFGLFSIRERFRCLGGKMTINTAGDKGSEVVLSLPRQAEICGGGNCGN
jgi:signal transduction histidine kinase